MFGCIAKSITDHDVKQLLRILVKALESFSDITLIEAIVMCLTRMQPLLRAESPIHKALFWVAISILQLDEIQLYASGLALLEQNLLTLESMGAFDLDCISQIMLGTREPLEWYFKQLDHSVGLSFKANFHFALVGHLIKGYRHPSSVTVSRTTRIIAMLLDIVAKPSGGGRDKYEVNKDNVAYLAALVSVSEDVRSRCHVKHNFSDVLPDSPTFDSFAVDNHLKGGAVGAVGGGKEEGNVAESGEDKKALVNALVKRGSLYIQRCHEPNEVLLIQFLHKTKTLISQDADLSYKDFNRAQAADPNSADVLMNRGFPSST